MRGAVAIVAALLLAGSALASAPQYRPDASGTAAAHAALLRLEDFGLGWEGGQTPTEPLGGSACPGFDPKASDLTVTGHVNATFHNGQLGLDVAEDVQIMTSAASVAIDFARTIQPKLAPCLAYELRHAKGEKSIARVAVSAVAFPGLGYTGPVAKVPHALFRAEVAFLLKGRRVDYVSDYLFIGVGAAEFTLNVIVPAVDRSQLIPFETAVAELLVKRAP